MGSLESKTIYAIQHNVTKRIYVGCTVHLYKRIREHICHLRNGKHTNSEMQKDYDLYGEDFSYYIIEENVPYSQLGVNPKFSLCFDRERLWMCTLKSNEIATGYNLMKHEQAPTIDEFQNISVKIGKQKKRKT